VWRSIAVRHELLRALLNADLIGFLLFEYTRNFLSCCKRMLGLEYEFHKGGYLGVEYEGRHIMLQVATFGISPQKISARLNAMRDAGTLSETFAANVPALAQLDEARSRKAVVIAGVDYLDRLKGVAHKFLAWETLLQEYPRYRAGHLLVQVCVGARNRIHLSEASDVERELQSIVDRINQTYPGSVLFHVAPQISRNARLMLWCAADIFVCTSVRESINVWPLEFVQARHSQALPPGVLILSEFTGFARLLNGALRVNPFSQSELVESFDKALVMPHAERAARGHKDVCHIERCSLEEFARRFITDLKSCASKREEDFVSVGFGLASFRLVGMGARFEQLDTTNVLDKFQSSCNRTLLLDWGGTLTPANSGFLDPRDIAGYTVPPRVLNALGTLCADPKTNVMVLSGLSKDQVMHAFGSVPRLSLAVEHGFNYCLQGGPWQELVGGADASWFSVAESVMDTYSARTHGAYVQAKGSSISWHFQESDPEFGVMQAKEMQLTLQQVLSAFPVVVRTGKGYVEACRNDVNKGAMADRFVELCSANGKPVDFVFCAGDDSTDELMFAALKDKLGETAPQLITCTVGRKPSEASTYLNDDNDVVELLELLSERGSDPPIIQASSVQRSRGDTEALGTRRARGSSSFANLAALG